MNTDNRQKNLDVIRNVLQKHARLAVDVQTLDDLSDLYSAGLTSLTTVNVMLALEDQFNVEFSDSMLGRKTFQSIQSIYEAIEILIEQ